MSLPYPSWSVVYGEQPTAAKWSELGANDDALAAGTGFNAGAIPTAAIANAAVTASKLATGAASAVVATSETTTSSGFTDLSTAGPAVTVTIGANGLALVVITSHSFNSTSNDTFHGFALSGANTVSASDDYAKITSFTTGSRASAVFLLTGLTAGSTTFTCKYRAAGGTGTWVNRRIAAIPL